jgi:hypothetical protein
MITDFLPVVVSFFSGGGPFVPRDPRRERVYAKFPGTCSLPWPRYPAVAVSFALLCISTHALWPVAWKPGLDVSLTREGRKAEFRHWDSIQGVADYAGVKPVHRRNGHPSLPMEKSKSGALP